MKRLKRVALIQPPRKKGTLYCFFPIGLLSLASAIKEYDYQPIFIDLYLLSIIKKDFSDFFRQMAKEILSHDPEVLGFSVICNTLPGALLIAKECKKMAPELPIIFGGPEVCFEQIEVLKTFEQVNLIVRGEAEITLVEVLRALENRKPLSDILGITYRENGKIIRNPDRPFIKDLDQLPFLDFSLVPRLKMYEGLIEAGRGCPYSCTFCSSCRIWKRNFRMKSPQRLVRELKQARDLFKNSCIEIVHDHFLASRKFVDEFLPLIANEGISWTCVSRFDTLDGTIIKKLNQTGCRQICLGIEAGSPEMQKQIKKNLPLAKLPQVLQMLCQNKIEVFLCFVIGFPDETESQINQTLLLALNTKVFYPSVEAHIFLLTFLKGSELYKRAKEQFAQYEFLETHCSPVATGLLAEISLIKKYPHIFPSFYYFGKGGLPPEILQKTANLFSFMVRSYARPALALLEHLSLTPFQLGLKLISFFDVEGVEWSSIQGYHFPQFAAPFRKFIQEYASPLYKEFFWWDEAFKQWGKKKERIVAT